jgi:hypothetical protein
MDQIEACGLLNYIVGQVGLMNLGSCGDIRLVFFCLIVDF